MAVANRLWGTERIRGELLKLGIHVAKSTIQKYLREARPPRRTGQLWATFLRSHAAEIRACDFLPVTDLPFRPVYAFFVIAPGSRRVVHVGVTRHPTDAWAAQQRRGATPFGQLPRYLIRDNDGKYGRAFARVAAASGITEPRTAVSGTATERHLRAVPWQRAARVPRPRPGLGEAQLRRVLREYVRHFNLDRPHQGLAQRVPTVSGKGPARAMTGGSVQVTPIPGGLHHAYARAA